MSQSFWQYMATLGPIGALLLFNYLDRRAYMNNLEKLTEQFVILSQSQLRSNQANEILVDKMIDIVRTLKRQQN